MLESLLDAFSSYYDCLDAVTLPMPDGGRRIPDGCGAVALSESTDGLFGAIGSTYADLLQKHGRPLDALPDGIQVITSSTPGGPVRVVPADQIKATALPWGQNGAEAKLITALRRAQNVAAFPADRWNAMQQENPGANHRRYTAGDIIDAQTLAVLESVRKLLVLCQRTEGQAGLGRACMQLAAFAAANKFLAEVQREGKAELARIQSEAKRDEAQARAEWEARYGQHYPESIDDWAELAARAGIEADTVHKGHWTLADVGPIVQGYLARIRDRSLPTYRGDADKVTQTAEADAPKPKHSWTQDLVDEAIRKYWSERSCNYSDLKDAIKKEGKGAKKKARTLFGRNKLADHLGCSKAMVSNSRVWRGMAQELGLAGTTPGVGRGDKIGHEIAVEKASVQQRKKLQELIDQQAADDRRWKMPGTP